uniref:Tripeptidyl-peptidase 2 n=1 Tax=Rhizochromulina marina TaxID=1034831 RepID=A0A7S2RCW9_9STRA
MSAAEAKEEGRVLEGKSGRLLRIPAEWKNPSGKWQVGLKRGYELFPRTLVNRVKAERKKDWILQQHTCEAALKQREAALKAAKAPEDQVKDVEACLEVLSQHGKDVDSVDPGPVFDAVAWHDGEEWVAAISSDPDGDLSKAVAMRSYRVAREFSTFSEVDSMNYCFNVCDDGAVLTICADAGAHGTHVAGIVSAYHPDKPEACGVAPGAQIVSLKIGDTRLGSMETGPGLQRALIEAVKHKVDVINMSYGEANLHPDKGRFVRLAEEVVKKHGIVFLCSAGNNGPALTTVGAPGGTSSSLIGVAAYVTPRMMDVQYSIVESSLQSPYGYTDGITYTWSSVGPTSDGDTGVNITSPGGAITSVPNWTLQKSQLMNGTSMSSPNAAGCFALLISALKQSSMPYTVHRLRRAVENSCQPIQGVHALSQGRGLVQVDDAFTYCQEHAADAFEDVEFKVSVGQNKRGVYLRQLEETSAVSSHSVSVKPVFLEHAKNAEKHQFELQLQLESSANWLTCPAHLVLMHGGRGFSLVVDPMDLPPGLHFAKVSVFPAGATGAPLFEVPVTVVKPLAVASPTVELACKCSPGAVLRHFLTPPAGATWVDFTVTDQRSGELKSADTAPHLYVLHCLQLLPKTPYRDQELHKYLYLAPGQKKHFSMPLQPYLTLEATLAQYWSSQGSSSVSLTVDFRGVEVLPGRLALASGGGPARLMLRAGLRDEEVQPRAKLTSWRRPLLPATSSVEPLGARDVLPSGKQLYQLVLQYSMAVETACEVTPRAPLLNGVLYEAEFDSQMVQVFDAKKKFIGCADAWPSAVKLPAKGTYTFRLQVRHEDTACLEKLRKMVLWAERALKDAAQVQLPVFSDEPAVVAPGASALGERRLVAGGGGLAAVVAEPAFDKLPKGVAVGDVFEGSLHCVKKSQDLERPKGWPLTYTVSAVPLAEEAQSKSSEDAEKSPKDKLAEELRDLKMRHLSTLSGQGKDDEWEQLFIELAVEFPSYLPLKAAKLHHLDKETSRTGHLPSIVQAADDVITSIDATALAAHFGLKLVQDDKSMTEARKQYTEDRGMLVDALARKARAKADLEACSVLPPTEALDLTPPEGPATGAAAEAEAKEAGASDGDFEATMRLLQQWEDVTEPSKADCYARIHAAWLVKQKKLGAVLKYLRQAVPETKDGDLEKHMYKLRGKVQEALGWSHISEHDQIWSAINRPEGFSLF